MSEKMYEPKNSIGIFKEFVDFYTPTEEQLQRKFTDEELKFICLHQKVKVDMTLFNPMFDCIEDFKKTGRSDNWSQRLLNKMVCKTLNHHMAKHGDVYPEEQIKAYNLERWKQEKNFNIRFLEYHCEMEKEKQHQSQREDSSDAAAAASSDDRTDTAVSQKNEGVIKEFLCIGTESLDFSSQNVLSSQSEPVSADYSNFDPTAISTQENI